MQGTNWFKTSGGARECHCLGDSSYLPSGKGLKGTSSSNSLFFMEVTVLLTTSEGGHDSNHMGLRESRLRCISLFKSTGTKQGCSLCWALWFWNRLLCSSHGWTNTAHVINIHTITYASSLKHTRMVCHCTCGVWVDKICWAEFCLWLFWWHAGETWVIGVCWGSLFSKRRLALEVEHKQTKIIKIAAAATI